MMRTMKSTDSSHPDLWTLALEHPTIDPRQLAAAVERQIASGDLDFRTRLLIRDSLDALEQIWGSPRFNQWLTQSSAAAKMTAICAEELGESGFSSLQGAS